MYKLLCIFALIGLVGSAAHALEKRVALRNISSDYPLYYTVFLEKTTGSWPFRKTKTIRASDAPIVELFPGETNSFFLSENGISIMENGHKHTVELKSAERAMLVFASFKESLEEDDFLSSVKNQSFTSLDIASLKSSEVFLDVLVQPGYEQDLFPKIAANKKASRVVHAFYEARAKHPYNLDVINRSNYPIFVAAYNCVLDVGDVVQNKRCTRSSGVMEVSPNSSKILSDLSYDIRASIYKNEPANAYFAYLITSRMEDDLTPERDLRESAMRHVVKSTRRAYNAIYDLVKHANVSRIWLDVTLNGIYITDSYVDLSKITKALQDAAVGLAGWIHWKDYEKWAKPFKEVITEIAHDPHRFVGSSVRESEDLCNSEENFLKNRRSFTDQGFFDMGVNEGHFPTIGISMSGGGYRAMISSLGFVMGLKDIGVLNAATYMAGLSGSSWFLSKLMIMASERDKQGQAELMDLEHLRKDIIERTQKIRLPDYKRQVQLAYMLKPLFKKFVYYQPITPLDLYGVLLGSTLLDLGSPDYKEYTFSGFAKVTRDGAVPMPIGTTITKTNAHWYELNPFEVGSQELNAYIPSFSFGRTYRKGIAVDNAPELTIHNDMAIMGSAFALKGFDFLRHVGPNLDFLPSGLSEHFSTIINLSNKLGLLSVAEKATGVSFSSLMDVIHGKADETIGYWQKAYDSMPYGFVFIAKPELGKEGLGWQNQSAIPAGITPNPFYKLRESSKGDDIFSERYSEFRDAGIDFNVPFTPLLWPARNVNVIFAFDASGDVLKNGASSLRLAEAYAKQHGLSFPTVTDEDFRRASTENLAVIGDVNDKNALTIIYMTLLKNDQLEGELGEYSPLDDPTTGTFNFAYPRKNSTLLIDSVRQNVVFHKAEIIDVLKKKSGMKVSADIGIP